VRGEEGELDVEEVSKIEGAGARGAILLRFIISVYATTLFSFSPSKPLVEVLRRRRLFDHH